MKTYIPYFGKEHVIVLLSAVGFLLHLIDELIHQADIPPAAILLLVTVTWTCYPLFPRLLRGILGIMVSIGILTGLSANHLIPFFQTGETEGLLTALTGTVLVLGTGYYAVSLLFTYKKGR